MSKTCGHTVPCGCNDRAYTTPPPCKETEECAGNPCAENFFAECIIWCGDTVPGMGITTGMTLYQIIQRIEAH